MYASKHTKWVSLVGHHDWASDSSFRCPECGKRDFPMVLNPETGGECCYGCLPSQTTFRCEVCDTTHTLGIGPLFGNGWHPDESSMEILAQVQELPDGKSLWAKWAEYCHDIGHDTPDAWDTPEDWDWEKMADFSQILHEYSESAIFILNNHASPECWCGWSQGDFGHYAIPAEYCADHVEW